MGLVGGGKDPDEMVKIVGDVKEKYVQHEAVKAANKAVAVKNDRRSAGKPLVKNGGGQQAASPAPATARGAFRAYVERCWHCGGTYMQVHCPGFRW